MIDFLTKNPKRLVFVDACGATLSAVLLGLVLPRFETLIGLSSGTLHFLSGVACAIAFFSWAYYMNYSRFGRSFLKPLSLINLAYCLVTLSIVLYFNSKITGLGLLYFIIEIMIILSIAYTEFNLKVE